MFILIYLINFILLLRRIVYWKILGIPRIFNKQKSLWCRRVELRDECNGRYFEYLLCELAMLQY